MAIDKVVAGFTSQNQKLHETSMFPYFFLSSSRLLFVDTLDVMSHLVSTFT